MFTRLPRVKSQERFRHELKYLIGWGEKEKMTARMEGLLHRDPNAVNGIYRIRSLYFDDYRDSAYTEKEAGVLERKKYRIRVYNYSDSVIKLERKKKYDSYIFKESASLTREEFHRIMDGDYGFLLCSDKALCREFYIECMCRQLRPRVIVDYEREPWILDTGTVRITFDMNVRAAVGSFDIFDAALPCLPAVAPNRLVLEVKYTELLPEILRDILPLDKSEFSAVSKYILCRDKTQYRIGEDYWYDEGSDEPGVYCPYPISLNTQESKGDILL